MCYCGRKICNVLRVCKTETTKWQRGSLNFIITSNIPHTNKDGVTNRLFSYTNVEDPFSGISCNNYYYNLLIINNNILYTLSYGMSVVIKYNN